MKTKTIIEIAQKFKTPFYLYDEAVLESSFNQLRNAFPKQVDFFYSIKANPNIAICDALRSMGACAEICSFYEIEAALLAGFKPENMIFVGPAKSNKEIKKCLDLEIYAIVCESLNEFERIEKIAAEKNLIARVALRINPSHVSKTALLKMGGKSSQFGMDQEIVLMNQDRFLNSRHIKIIGIHVYNGTRILDEQTICENTRIILNLAKEIQYKWKKNFEMVDLGGGLGVPYFDNENSLNLVNLKRLITPVINEYLNEFQLQKIILESGRFLVANSGCLVSQIIDIKISKSENMIITDGGTNCHMAAVGIGSLVKRNFPISLIQKTNKKSEFLKKYNITGPLCTPNDLIGKAIELPCAEIGDYIVIHRSGAYGPSASPVMFLSHGFPAEIMYKNNKSYVIRERFKSEDFFNKQKLINL